MRIALILLVAGVIAGLARGGKLTNIAEAEIRWPGLVFAGLGMQVAAELWTVFVGTELRDRAGILILAVSYLLIFAFIALNRELPGRWFIGAGLLFNMLVILANGGMPVSLKAARASGLRAAEISALGSAFKHQLMTTHTALWFLGDWIPIPGLHNVISLGDILLGTGVFILMERLVRYEPRRRSEV